AVHICRLNCKIALSERNSRIDSEAKVRGRLGQAQRSQHLRALPIKYSAEYSGTDSSANRQRVFASSRDARAGESHAADAFSPAAAFIQPKQKPA
ncbi:MAG: hypothetical protein QOH24_1364, partial [Verrucomicrobiota bacterium]